MDGQEQREEPQVFQVSDPCATLRRASRAVTHLYDLIFSPIGLKSTQFVLLHAIHRCGERAHWQLANDYGIAEDTLSRRLAALRRADLIQYRKGRQRPGEKVYSLTSTGLETYERGLPYWIRAQERLRLIMGDERWDSLIRMADEVVTQARHAEAARVCNVAKVKALASVEAVAEGKVKSAAA